MKKNNIIVRIVAIVLCAIMVLGVVTAAFSAFAASPDSTLAPDTGSQPMVWVIVAVVAAVAVIAGCLIIPKVNKK